MAKFKQTVIETRHYEVEYVVEAKNAKEASRKVEAGETIEENEIKFVGVVARDSWDEPKKL